MTQPQAQDQARDRTQDRTQDQDQAQEPSQSRDQAPPQAGPQGNSIGDLVPMSEIAAMSGLDYLRGMLAGRYPPPPIAATMGFNAHAFDIGLAVFRGTPELRVMNPIGSVHGGWYGTILDSAMGCAVMTRLQIGQAYTTLEYKVNITRAIPPGTEVECRAEIDHFGRSTAVAHAEIRGLDTGKLYATGTTTCLVMQAPTG